MADAVEPTQADPDRPKVAGASSRHEDPRRDLGWLALAVVGGAVFHFGWTVPRGPFEASSRSQDRSHAAFVRLQNKYQDRSFEQEPKRGIFSKEMRWSIERAVGLARSRAIARGSHHWTQAGKIQCRSLSCRFDLCIPSAEQDAFEQDLRRLKIGTGEAWVLHRMEPKACPRYQVRFLSRPSAQRRVGF